MLWQYWQEDWLLYHKIIFDGESKRIYIAPGATYLSVKDDIYSSWKEWSQLRDNAKFLPAFRSIGGDPVGGGLYAGDIYFLINGWQIEVDQTITVAGTLYHDDSLPPFIVLSGGGVTAVVSNLAYAYNTTGAATPPTVQEIRTEIDANSSKLIAIKAQTDTISDPWVSNIANYNTVGTIGNVIASIESISQSNSAKLTALQISINALAVANVEVSYDSITAIVNNIWNADITPFATSATAGKVLSSIPADVGNLQVTADTILAVTV